MSQSTTNHSALNSTSDSTSASAAVALAGRILISAIFLISGFSKVTNPSAILGYIGSAGLPFPQLALIVAIVVEIGGSLLLILGYRTRLVALVMAVFTVAAALAFHNHLADQNQFTHFFKNIAMAGGLLQVLAFGAGRLSLDARRRG
ncbi:LysR family transcriptional regulator [Pseudomonas agarici]|uniref:LysR family transcriptional regulator n=1 Tax=Pseudomonas agarici TaxID=46677 RepID=A0A0X1T1Z9_PSEAA|nr:DoxX family protein [Pseudomonas agarici]AMB86127.1 LysR family transcriptional regulator [Pseudomonas agarici]NWB94007.1 DoxX family protein [Pseudomonas agarici]NWC10500.1 DoxX family protein [Pseudomonas agarici]SEL39756.1 putative oxidoreductase [Pseudomonas agarici]